MLGKQSWKTTLLFVFFSLFLFTACGGQQAKPESQPAAQKPDPPLAKKYHKIVVMGLTSTPQIKKDYPDALKDCQASLVAALKNNKTFKSVVSDKSGSKHSRGSLLVMVNVSDMRIVAGAARFWGGWFAGSSYMNLDLKLVDSTSKKVVREKPISSSNNAYAAAWTGGSSDRTLPSDMGKIVAGYIGSIIPKK